MRVLLVGKGPPERGGIPTFLTTLLEGDLASQHEVTFLNLARGGTPQGGRASWANVRRTAGDTAAVWRAAAGQDVVHVHSSLAPSVTLVRAGLLALAARSHGCRVVVHAHGGLLLLWLTRRRRRWLARVALAPASLVLALSTELHARLATALGERAVALVDNGVDVSRFSETPTDHFPPRVLYVGLITPRKGLLDLLAASQLLSERGVVHEVWLVGGTPDEGPEAAEPVLLAAREVGARLLGQHRPEQMPAAYAEADLLCLPSWWEAMPLSVLEAMASGLPVVATDVGDVGRVVRTGITGTLVPPHDPTALADALQPLLSDPGLRRQCGRAGRALVTERFSASATARTLDRTYRELGAGRT
jgi:glycosyltransferase involved in cell wall biosynthesis